MGFDFSKVQIQEDNGYMEFSTIFKYHLSNIQKKFDNGYKINEKRFITSFLEDDNSLILQSSINHKDPEYRGIQFKLSFNDNNNHAEFQLFGDNTLYIQYLNICNINELYTELFNDFCIPVDFIVNTSEKRLNLQFFMSGEYKVSELHQLVKITTISYPLLKKGPQIVCEGIKLINDTKFTEKEVIEKLALVITGIKNDGIFILSTPSTIGENDITIELYKKIKSIHKKEKIEDKLYLSPILKARK